jgi:hypothetical protein
MPVPQTKRNARAKKKKKKNFDCPANKDLMMMGELRKKNTRKGIDGYDS